MPDKPTVKTFAAKGQLANGKTGLHATNNSTTPIELTGTNLVNQMAVTIKFGTDITWSGTLNAPNTTSGTATAKCSNPYNASETPVGVDGDLGDGEDVSVTVGSGTNTSPSSDPAPFKVNLDP